MATTKAYKLTAGDKEIFRRACDPGDGVGVNWFTSYYFGGRELREWQWNFHHAQQRHVTVVGGTGSGKTVGAGISYATWAAMTPRFSFMNLAPTSWQSKLMYEAILRESMGRPFERFIFKAIERPYPLIVLKSDYIGESTMHFMSAADCVVGDTKLRKNYNEDHEFTIAEMAERNIAPLVLSWHEEASSFRSTYAGVPYKKGTSTLYKVTLDNGYSIEVALNHRFYTPVTGCYLTLSELMEYDDPPYIGVFVPNTNIIGATIKDIEAIGEHDYYDLEVPKYHNYVAHGFINHNSAERIQGWEGDAMNGDEFGVILDGQWLLTMMVTRMRGNVPLPQGGFRNRLRRLSLITANYEFAPPWFWERMDRMHRDPKNFLSMQVKSSDNLSEEDIENYKLVIPEELWGQMLEGDKPEGKGEHFSIEAIQACEDKDMLRWAQYHLLEKDPPSPGWEVTETTGAGCIHFEMPSEVQSGRQYLLVGDPGQGNPPHRNAGVIIVWDITDFPKAPCRMRFFKWIYGNGSYDPFKIAYKYAWDKYRPVNALIDSTGTQKLWNEQILLNMGVWATGMDFSGQKDGMLVSAMQQVQRQLYKWPYILGIRSQLLRYSRAEDTANSKLPQDIAAVIMMTSWWLRQYLWEQHEERMPEEHAQLSSARDQRGGVVTPRTVIHLPQGVDEYPYLSPDYSTNYY